MIIVYDFQSSKDVRFNQSRVVDSGSYSRLDEI